MTLVDIEKLRQEIRSMTRKQVLYRVLRDELSALGYWKAKARGNPQEGYRLAKGALARGKRDE